MFYYITRSDLQKYLADYQKSVVNTAFEFKKISHIEIEKHSDDQYCFSKIFPYPVRLLIGEENFSLLNKDTLLFHERVINIICHDEVNNDSIGIKFYKSSLDKSVNFEIVNTEIIPNETVYGHDVLIAAGFLATFQELSIKWQHGLTVQDNFNDLPYSTRRYIIESILLSEKPSRGFFFLDEIHYLENVLPEIAAGKNLSQNKYHQYDIFEHLIRSCDAMEVPDLIMRFSSLLHDIGKVPTRKVKENGEATFYNHEVISSYMLVPIMKRFGIPKATGIKIKYYVRNHMFHYTDEWSDKAVRRFLRKVSREDLANLILLRKSDRIGSGKKNPFPKKLQSLIDHIEDVIMRDLELKVTDLEINGLDLMKMGLSEGPRIGKILNQLLHEVKNEITRNNHEDLLDRAKSLIFNSESEMLAHKE